MTSFDPRPIPPPLPIRLAVVGAGVAGLVAARELRREGHGVVVFERGNSVGGTWAYTPAVESDPLGLHPARNIVHSSIYHSLHTNLPREIMGFLDYPFVPRGDGDVRRYPGHEEVLRYLENFAEEFELLDLIRFGTEVESIEREVDSKRWIVKSGEMGNDGKKTREVYDCVVVCNGHYTQPHIAEIPGIGAWPGKQMHSHNYRVPEPFIDQVVIVIGNSNSSVDISRDVVPFAKEVHIACRSITGTVPSKVPGYENMWFHSMIERAEADGSVVFHDGSLVCGTDIIIHCTGYKYHFPFLETNGVLTVDDNCVGPLYKHVFPPQLAPSLSFIGIPLKAILFPLCELQSKWLAGILSGRIDLPSEEEMIRDVKADYKKVEMKGLPKRYTNNLSDVQFEYADWLAEQCGLPPVEDWRKALFVSHMKNRAVKPETFRAEWDDDHLVEQAYKFFDNLKGPSKKTH